MIKQEIVLFLILTCAKSQRNRQTDVQPRPERCERSAEFMYRQCCVFPPFFTRDIAKACGAVFKVNFISKEHNVTAFTRHALTTCNHWRCVLKKYGFTSPDGFLDDEKYFAHLDKWAELNPLFATVITNGQVHCKNELRAIMPMDVCNFYRLHICIRHFVNIDCPATMPTKECMEVKAFYDSCREFFL